MKVKVNEIISYNQMVKDLLYNNSKISNIDNYKNAILVVCEQFEKLGYLEVFLKKREYQFDFPKFWNNKFLVNIFYLFPKEYQLSKSKIRHIDEYIDIFLSGVELYKEIIK